MKKNKVVFTVNKNGSVNVKIDNSLFEEEFKKVQAIYGLNDMYIDLFKADGMIFVLSQAIQGWITSFEGDVKNDYYLAMDYTRVSDERYGDTYSVYHVLNGKPIYEQEDEEIEDESQDIITVSELNCYGREEGEELQGDYKEDLVEDSIDVD